jgi:hypothetical protein
MNFGGGIDYFTIQYVKKEELIGSYDKTMYSKVDSDKEGKRIESFFNSDIVKFIFLITQYASGAITQNEPLVANSITIPPEGTEDYYKFFGIEEHKKYIEDTLSHYELFKKPKQNKKVEEVAKPPKSATKKKSPIASKGTKLKRTIKITEKKGGGGKTKRKTHIKIPQKTRRKN